MGIRKRKLMSPRCTEKLMVILGLENKKLGTIIGREWVWRTQIIDLATGNKNYSMVLPWLYIMRDLIKVSPRQLLCRRLWRIRRP
jgi:hypothetical protein